jgi:hypothetical protein
MATLYAQSAMTWNGSAWSGAWNTAANGSGTTRAPVVGDVLNDNTYAITLSAPTVGMTLTTARALCRDHLRNGLDETLYSNTRLDRDIITLGLRLARSVRSVKASETIVLTPDDPDFDLASDSTCTPDALMEAYIVGEPDPLKLVEWTELQRLREDEPLTGVPEYIAFDDANDGELYPTPSSAYSLVLRFSAPFTTFTAGTATPDIVTLSLPYDLLAEVLPFGIPGLIHRSEPENQAYASQCWEEYLRLENSMPGHGNLGARRISRAKSSDSL